MPQKVAKPESKNPLEINIFLALFSLMISMYICKSMFISIYRAFKDTNEDFAKDDNYFFKGKDREKYGDSRKGETEKNAALLFVLFVPVLSVLALSCFTYMLFVGIKLLGQ